MSRNVLMVCYYYPPLADVGCKRSVAFSKYLKILGCNPYVLSMKNPDKAYCSVGNDAPPEGIHTEYSYSVFNVYRIVSRLKAAILRLLRLFNIQREGNDIYGIFYIPDHFVGWITLTILKGYRLKKFKIDIIYVSCSPF